MNTQDRIKFSNDFRLYGSVFFNSLMTIMDGFFGSKLMIISNIASLISDLSEPQVFNKEAISTQWRIPSLIVREMIDIAFVILSPDPGYVGPLYLSRYVFLILYQLYGDPTSTTNLFTATLITRFAMKYSC
jgi:hypothetical protein